MSNKISSLKLDVKRRDWIHRDDKTEKAPDFSKAFGLHWTLPDCKMARESIELQTQTANLKKNQQPALTLLP